MRFKTENRSTTLLVFCFIAFATSACRTPAPFPPIGLFNPLWQTRIAQAVWRLDADKPEIVGDVVYASDDAGHSYLQFSKALPIVTVRLKNDAWQAEFHPQDKAYSGHGNPPGRIVWLQLLRALQNGDVAKHWSLQRTEGKITLENSRSGERLELHF